MSSSDHQLLDRWAAGDRSAGSELFSRYFRSIYRFFRNKTDADPSDLTQRVFLRCMESKERYRRASSFRTFLFGIARNVLLEHFRESKAARKIDFETVSVADLGVSAGTVVAASEQHKVLLEALRRLPIDRQLLVELFYWEDMSIAELAEFFGVPDGTVKRWLWRSRQQLARFITECEAAGTSPQAQPGSLESWVRALRDSHVEHDDTG